MKRHSLRDREPEEIREFPALVEARSELAADSQSLRWLLHPARHTRLIRHYVEARTVALDELEGAVPEEPLDPLPDPVPPFDWEADGVFGGGSRGGK